MSLSTPPGRISPATGRGVSGFYLKETLMKLNVTLGQDLSAYAEIEMEAPEGASEIAIVAAIRRQIDGDFPVFDEDWESTSSL